MSGKVDRRAFIGSGAAGCAGLILGANRAWASEGKDRYALQDRISAAWTNFARTGNPNHKGLPNWPAFDTTKRATMLFNNDCKVADDPNGEERRLVASLRRA